MQNKTKKWPFFPVIAFAFVASLAGCVSPKCIACSSLEPKLGIEKKSTRLPSDFEISRYNIKSTSVDDDISAKGDCKVNVAFDSDWFKVGGFSHFYRITPLSIKKVKGVYSNLFPYVSKNALADESVSYKKDTDYIYTETKTETVSFEIDLSIKIFLSLWAKLASKEVSAEAAVSSKEEMSYNYANSKTFSSTSKVAYSSSMRLNSASTKSCPDGYSMSLGLVGTYYVINASIQEYTIWWWGNSPTSGQSTYTRECVYSNESTMSQGYVFQITGDSEHFYYQ